MNFLYCAEKHLAFVDDNVTNTISIFIPPSGGVGFHRANMISHPPYIHCTIDLIIIYEWKFSLFVLKGIFTLIWSDPTRLVAYTRNTHVWDNWTGISFFIYCWLSKKSGQHMCVGDAFLWCGGECVALLSWYTINNIIRQWFGVHFIHISSKHQCT